MKISLILAKKKFKTLFFPSLFLFFILSLIIFPQSSLKAGQYGFNLWLNIVFPSLLPFFIAAELLSGTGLIRSFGILLEPIMRPLFNVPGVGSFPFAMGISSGYPVGAKITVDLRKQNLCSKAEAERLLTFTNNSSPLFITGAVATGILGVPQLGLLLLLTHLAGCITVGLLFRFYKPSKTVSHQSSSLRNPVSSLPYQQVRPNIGFYNIGKKLGDAINNSINTLLLICGFIIVFSVFTNILINLKIVYFLACGVKFVFQYIGIAFSLAFPVICGFFEITSGINYINMQFAPIDHKIIIAAFVLGWGGLSVHAQVASIIAHTDISIKPYLFGKLLHGLFSAIYVAMALSTTGLLKTPTSFVFNRMIEMQAAPWRDLEKTSFGMIGLFIGLIGLSYLLRKKIKALDFISKEYMIK